MGPVLGEVVKFEPAGRGSRFRDQPGKPLLAQLDGRVKDDTKFALELLRSNNDVCAQVVGRSVTRASLHPRISPEISYVLGGAAI